MARAVVNEVRDKGIKQPRKVMEYLQSRLKEFAERVEKQNDPPRTLQPAQEQQIQWGPRRAAWGT